MTPAKQTRSAGLDAARAFAVLAMVGGHTLDAVLSPAARQLPAVAAYWHFRAFTAPLFLLVSGLAVAFSMERHALTGAAVLRRYLPRVALLLGLGYLLRFPAWDLPGLWAGKENVLRHFFGFDALHCIGASLFLAAAMFSLIRSSAHRIVALAFAIVAIALGAKAGHAALASAPLVLRQMLGGGTAQFPLLPWAGYFFTGALIGLVLARFETVRSRALLLVGAAVVLFLATRGMNLTRVPPTDAGLFVYRLVPPLLLVGGALLLPSSLAVRLAPIGRASLWVYVIHLPIAYGWALWPGLATRVGKTMGIGEGLALAAAVVLVSVGLGVAGQWAWRRGKAELRQRRSTVSAPSEAVAGGPVATGAVAGPKAADL